MDEYLSEEIRHKTCILRKLPEETYLWIANIPETIGSKDMRNYFSYLIKKEAFITFNYRHRTENTFLTFLKHVIKDALSLTTKTNLSKEATMLNSTNSEHNTIYKGIENLTQLFQTSEQASEKLEHEVIDMTNSEHNTISKGIKNITQLIQTTEQASEKLEHEVINDITNSEHNTISKGIENLTELVETSEQASEKLKHEVINITNSEHNTIFKDIENLTQLFQTSEQASEKLEHEVINDITISEHNAISKGIENITQLIQTSEQGSEKSEHKVINDINSSMDANVNATILLKDMETNLHITKKLKEIELKCPESDHRKTNRRCCLLRIKNEFLDSFISLYHKKFWVTESGIILPIRCLIFNLTSVMNLDKIVLKHPNKDGCDPSHYTRCEMSSQMQNILFQKILNFPDFRKIAPSMPQGNIGTPDSYFKKLLVESKLPIECIKKYGIDVDERPKRKYRRVDMNYGTEVEAGGVHFNFKKAISTNKGDLIPGYFDIKFNKSLQQDEKPLSEHILGLENEEEDRAEVEEWDRFMSYYDDVSKQEWLKEKLFESEIEQVCAKGGLGLVFYNNAQFWRVCEKEEKDKWEVKKAGNMDARASMSKTEMNRSKARKIQPSVFSMAPDPSVSTVVNNYRFKQILTMMKSRGEDIEPLVYILSCGASGTKPPDQNLLLPSRMCRRKRLNRYWSKDYAIRARSG